MSPPVPVIRGQGRAPSRPLVDLVVVGVTMDSVASAGWAQAASMKPRPPSRPARNLRR